MSAIRFTGSAVATTQVNTITPANPLVTNTFSVTINGKTITYTAGAAPSVASVVTALVALLSASTIFEFAEITWTDSTTCVTATSKTSGTFFTQTSSATGGTAALVTATTTAGTGPNFWDNALNWSGGAVPVDTNDVTIDSGNWAIVGGLNQSGVTLASLTITSTFTGTIGLPNYNATGYNEYRPTSLTIKSPTITIEDVAGQGSNLIRINGSSQDTNLIVRKSPNGNNNIPAILFIGTGANTINVSGGDVGVAFFGGEVATVASVLHSGGTLQFGVGLTWSTCTIVDSSSSGDLTYSGSPTAVKKIGSARVIQLAGDVTTLTLDQGTFVWRDGGTIATINGGPNGNLDCSADNRTKTATALNLSPGFKINDPRGTLVVTGFTLKECGLDAIQWISGPNRTGSMAG